MHLENFYLVKKLKQGNLQMLTMCECSSSFLFFLLDQSLNHHVLFSINIVKSILTCCQETPTQVINLPLQPAWVTLTEPAIRERLLSRYRPNTNGNMLTKLLLFKHQNDPATYRAELLENSIKQRP